jgi:hypothetical protein
LNKETEQKEDGRYMIFYTFEEEKEENPTPHSLLPTPAEQTHRPLHPDSV